MEDKKVDILGVKINPVTMDQALEIVHGWLKEKGKHYIVTPNPEFVMLAQKDSEFRKIINEADLAIPDGAGLKLSGKIKQTVTGTDLMEEICKKAGDWGITVGFLGGKDGVAEKAKDCLQKRYPGLKIIFAGAGPEVDDLGNVLSIKYYGKDKVKKPLIHNTYPIIPVNVLFVAFGQGKQEKWIAKNLDKLPVKVAIGIGGAFDYFAGEVKRAPKFMRNLGLEWLFRLIMQPWRVKRQLALIKYVCSVKTE